MPGQVLIRFHVGITDPTQVLDDVSGSLGAAAYGMRQGVSLGEYASTLQTPRPRSVVSHQLIKKTLKECLHRSNERPQRCISDNRTDDNNTLY